MRIVPPFDCRANRASSANELSVSSAGNSRTAGLSNGKRPTRQMVTSSRKSLFRGLRK